MEHPENIPSCSLYQVTPTLKISCNVANRETDKQTDQPTDNDENITFVMAEVMIMTSLLRQIMPFSFNNVKLRFDVIKALLLRHVFIKK